MTTSYMTWRAALASQPLVAMPHALAGVQAYADARHPVSRSDARRPGRPVGGAAVIPVLGFLEQHRGWLSMLGLGTSTEAVSAQLRAAIADPDVSRIVLDVDSDGGGSYGVQELADEIFSARSQKPIAAVVNSVAGSGAYWIASQAAKCYVAPGGVVGGIGAYIAHEDHAEEMKKAGIEITFVSAGKYKVEGNPFGPLDSEAKLWMQQQVIDTRNRMAAAIARGRATDAGTVRSKFGQGRMLMAEDARKAGMVDAVATLDEVLRGRTAGGVKLS